MNGNIIKSFISFDRYNQCRVKKANAYIMTMVFAKINKIIRKSKNIWIKMIYLEFFCIVDERRIFNSSQLDNSIFHDLGFDKPLYGQNSIPTDGFPKQL